MRIYDLQSNTLVKEVPESTTAAVVQFNDTGKTVTTVAIDGTIIDYSVVDWRKVTESRERRQQRGDIAVHRLEGHSLTLSFDSNGAVAMFEGDLAHSTLLRGHGSSGESIAVDGELDQIVTAHRDGAVLRWDLRHPRDLSLSTQHVAFTADGAVAYAGLASSSGNDATQLCGIDVTSGEILGYLRWYPWSVMHDSLATQMAYSPDGRRLAVATKSGWGHGRWRIYDLWTGIAEHEELPRAGDLECIDWTADGRWVAVGGDRYGGNAGSIRIYDGKTYRQVAQIDNRAGAVHALCFSHDGQRLVTTGEDGRLSVWKVPGGKLLNTIGRQGGSALNCLINSPDGGYVAAGSADGTVAVWNPLSGKEHFRAKVHGAAVTCLAFAPDGSRLVTAAADRSVKVFDSKSWGELLTLYLGESARALSFSPDGKRLACAASSLTFLDTEKETARCDERRLAREEREPARRLAKSVLQKTPDPFRARELIVSDASLDNETRNAALRELRALLDAQWKEAYRAKDLFEILSRQILRQQFSTSGDFGSQRQKLFDAIGTWTNLDAIRRQAIAEFAAAYLNWYHPDTNALAWEIVSDPGRSPDDHLLAYFGMGPFLQQNPQNAAFLNTMAMAEYRVGLYSDAQESAERSEALSQDAKGGSPHNIAIIAMSQCRAGQTKAALESMRKLDELMKESRWSADREALALRDEAKKVIASPKDKPWNEQAARESCKTRMERMNLDKTKRAIWYAWSVARIARRHSERGENEKAEAAWKEAQALCEAQLAMSPEESSVQRALADLILASRRQTDWTVLSPTEMKSDRGAKLTLEKDGSVLASGEVTENDSYRIASHSNIRRIAAVRLEALPHPSLPGGGPGWGGGNFHLTEFRAALRRSSGETVALSFAAAAADYVRSLAEGAQPKDGPWATVDGDQTTRWDVWPQTGKKHWLVLQLTEPIAVGEDDRLSFELDFRDPNWKMCKLGCFRLSVSADRQALEKEQERLILHIEAISGSLSLAVAYLTVGEPGKAIEILERAAKSPQSGETAVCLFLLTRAHHQLNQAQEARDCHDRLLGWLRQKTVPASLRSWMAESMIAVCGLNRTEANSMQERWALENELTRLGQEIARNPKSPENYAQRAVLMSRLGKWRESADDQLRQVELQPGDRYAWLRAAPLSILAGDTQRYQELCRKSVAQFRGAKQPDVADVVCKICLLRPGSVDMAELPVKALRDGCQAAEFQGFRPWFTACSALIAYREGNSQLAKELTKEAGNAPIGQPQALALTVRSMAEHRLGETGQARKTLAQATAVIPDELRTLGASSYAGPIPVPAEKVSHDWLIPEILRREAAALINGSQAQH